MQHTSTNGSPSNIAELAWVQTHGNEHRKKPINFKALLFSNVLCWLYFCFVFVFSPVVHINVTRALLTSGFLFLNKIKVSLFLALVCSQVPNIKTGTKPFSWWERMVAATESLRFWCILSKCHCAQILFECFSTNFWVCPVSISSISEMQQEGKVVWGICRLILYQNLKISCPRAKKLVIHAKLWLSL